MVTHTKVTRFSVGYQRTRCNDCKGAPLCRSYNYAITYEEIRSYHSRITAISLATSALRPIYKVLVSAYCALNGLAPYYLRELISCRHINITLRSASQPRLMSASQPRLMFVMTYQHHIRKLAFLHCLLDGHCTQADLPLSLTSEKRNHWELVTNTAGNPTVQTLYVTWQACFNILPFTDGQSGVGYFFMTKWFMTKLPNHVAVVVVSVQIPVNTQSGCIRINEVDTNGW